VHSILSAHCVRASKQAQAGGSIETRNGLTLSTWTAPWWRSILQPGAGELEKNAANIRDALPFSTPRAWQARVLLGNQAGMAVMSLHTELHDPIDRLQDIRRGAAIAIVRCPQGGSRPRRPTGCHFAWQKRNAYSGCHVAEALAPLRDGVFR